MLNGKYRKLKGKFTLSYGTRNSREEAQLLVYGDGKLIYSSPVLTGGVMPIDFTVDVEGVLRMKIMTTRKTGGLLSPIRASYRPAPKDAGFHFVQATMPLPPLPPLKGQAYY